MPDVRAREQLKPEPCTPACTPAWGGMSWAVSLSQDLADGEILLFICSLLPRSDPSGCLAPAPSDHLCRRGSSGASSPLLCSHSSPWPLVSLLCCRGEIPSHLDSTSENKCLRNIWDSCSQRLLLSHILQELFYQSTAISCLDTSSDCARAQNPERQQWTKVSECPFGHCHCTEAELFLYSLET